MTGRPSEHGRYGPVAPGATESNPAAEQVDKTRRVLAHLEALERDARTIVAEGRQAFTRMINRRAALSVIIDVSSAIEKLPATFKEARPHIPWEAIRGMRNILAHDYQVVRDDLLWQTLVRDIPELVDQITSESQ